MCEGPNELEVINILLDNHALEHKRDDLLDRMAFHARSIKKPPSDLRIALEKYPEGELFILRVGDIFNSKLDLPKEYKGRILGVEDYCTKPELEMLLIIGEDLFTQFQKVKSGTRPKTFAKMNIKWQSKKKKRYDNSTAFYSDYFRNRPSFLISVIKEYKRKNKNHEKDEHYLAELLNEIKHNHGLD